MGEDSDLNLIIGNEMRHFVRFAHSLDNLIDFYYF